MEIITNSQQYRGGNAIFHGFRNDTEFLNQIDYWRDNGRSWDEIDSYLGISKGRSRRLYKRVCARFGLRDFHYYRHCLSY